MIFTFQRHSKKKNQHQVHHKHGHVGSGNVLVMDDEESILRIADSFIKEMGYKTYLAKNGAQAVKIYKENHEKGIYFCLVILDLTIQGGMGGLKTFHELQKFDPDVKAVISSGYSNDSALTSYQDHGFVGVLPKPFTRDDYIKLFDKILSR